MSTLKLLFLYFFENFVTNSSTSTNLVFHFNLAPGNFVFRKVGGAKLQGHADNRFYATRYDYLLVAKAMLDDWQKDTCVGKYLKTIFERQKKKMVSEYKQNGPKVMLGCFKQTMNLFQKKDQ